MFWGLPNPVSTPGLKTAAAASPLEGGCEPGDDSRIRENAIPSLFHMESPSEQVFH